MLAGYIIKIDVFGRPEKSYSIERKVDPGVLVGVTDVQLDHVEKDVFTIVYYASDVQPPSFFLTSFAVTGL